MPIIDLQMQTISALDHGLDCCVHDAAKRQADLYPVSNLELPWAWFSLLRHGEIVGPKVAPILESVATGRTFHK